MDANVAFFIERHRILLAQCDVVLRYARMSTERSTVAARSRMAASAQ
jgi:hypothetical protein